MSEVSELINQILDVEALTVYVVIMLCVLAALLTREVTGGFYLAAASVPVYVMAALTFLYVARVNQIVLADDPAVQAIIASVIGIMAIFMVVLIVMDICRSISDWQVNRMIGKRKMANRMDEAVGGNTTRSGASQRS
ncbi:MAG: hypothetical protein RIC14_01575 [Filomicrobium sp.]